MQSSKQVLFFFAFILQLICINKLWSQEDIQISSPFLTVNNHLFYLTDKNYKPEQSAQSFLPKYSITERIELATKLKHVLDGYNLKIKESDLPRNTDFIDSLSGKSEFHLFPGQYPEIYLKKYNNIWYYSEETSLRIPMLYREIFPEWADNLISQLPDYFKKKYLSIALWQYLGLLLIILLAFILHFILSWIVDFILKKSVWEKIHIGRQHQEVLFKLAKFFSLIILMAIIKQLLPVILLDIKVSSFLYYIIDILQTFFILMLSFQIVNIVKIYMILAAQKTDTKMDDQLVTIFIKSLKILIGIVAFIHLLSLLGVNVTALVAGASIGGLALALAAQDTFKNLFGSVMVFLDKPFQIGDFITTSDIEGTVEKVGFRSTRVRKIDTSIISIPNGNLANVTVTNLGIRKFRLMDLMINILYSTTPEKIESFLSELRKIPDSEPNIQKETWLIFLRNLSSSSIDVFFRIYIEAPDFKTELTIREQVVFKIMFAAKTAGVEFAYPSTSVYLEKTDFIDQMINKKE